MKKLILIALCFTLQPASRADEAVYVTDDGDVSLGIITNNMYVLKPDKLEAASNLLESRPATNFPEGNWGHAENGYQLSLRFEKDHFTNGEPINTIVLVRNVTNNDLYLTYFTFPVGAADGPIGFSIQSAKGDFLSQHEYVIGTIFGQSIKRLLSGTQCKYVERLDKSFDLTNDVYVVQAVKTVSYLPWPAKRIKTRPFYDFSAAKNFDIKSAEVSITIEPAR